MVLSNGFIAYTKSSLGQCPRDETQLERKPILIGFGDTVQESYELKQLKVVAFGGVVRTILYLWYLIRGLRISLLVDEYALFLLETKGLLFLLVTYDPLIPHLCACIFK